MQAQPYTQSSQPQPIVVVLTIDGVRWQEVIRGVDTRLSGSAARDLRDFGSASALMPNLHAIARSRGMLLGGDEHPMFASSPSTVSLPGYNEIFLGKTPACANNDCPPVMEDTLVDQLWAKNPHADLAIFSSWSVLARAVARQPQNVTISAGQNYTTSPERLCARPELCSRYRAGAQGSAAPGSGDYRPDRATSALALEYIRWHQPQFLFVGLGDTDEYAHQGNYAGYLRALQAADATLGVLYSWLLEKERRGARTLLICTADHGRAYGFKEHGGAPEAARVWALVAGAHLFHLAKPIGSQARLADIAPTVRDFLGLGVLPGPLSGSSLLSELSPGT